MAFTSSRLSRYSKTELFEAIGAPEWEEVKRVDGKPLDKGLPRQLVKKVEWTNWIDEDEEDIRIFDLGEAFVQGKEHKKLAQPGHLQVPETIFTDSFDYRVDLWRAGAVVRVLRHHVCYVEAFNLHVGRFMRSFSTDLHFTTWGKTIRSLHR